MNCLLQQLQNQGLRPHQIDQSLFVMYHWLQDHHPALAPLFLREIVRKVLQQQEANNSQAA